MALLRFPRKNAITGTPRYHSIVSWEPGEVRASVIEATSGSAQLIGVGFAPVQGIDSGERPDVDEWTKSCEEALSNAEEMTREAAGHRVIPDLVTMSVPPLLTDTHPIVVHRERMHPDRIISYGEMSALARRGYRQAQDELELGRNKNGQDVVFGSVARVLLDRQSVIDPLGLQGQEIEAHLSFDLLPVAWIRALEVVSNRLELCLAGIVPQQAAYASPLTGSDVLLIAIYDHFTSVARCRRGRIEWARLATMGERDIVMSTVQSVGLRGRQADTMLNAFRAGNLATDLDRILANAFWTELKRWMRCIADLVGEADQSGDVPTAVYVADTTRRFPEAAMALQEPYFEDLLPFGQCPQVYVMQSGNVGSVLDLTTNAADPGYLALRALAHYVARFYATNENLDRAVAENLRWKTLNRFGPASG